MPGPRSNLKPVDLPPPFPGLNEWIIVGGAPLSKEKRLQSFSDKEFESFVYEWAHYALKDEYDEVNILGGPGDLGRDVICWIDPPGTSARAWDNYQCKHYNKPVSPSDFWVELGKLVYYIFIGEFTTPRRYYLVATKGAGNKLKTLFNKPDALRDGLIEEWDDKCKSEITNTKEIELTGDFKKHVEKFDYSIFAEASALKILDEHEKFCGDSHRKIFGGKLKKRDKPLTPPSAVSSTETTYVKKLYAVYTKESGSEIRDPSDLKKGLKKHFDYSRKCYYCAESLKEFARDNLPNQGHFEDLEDQIYDGIASKLMDDYKSPFKKVLNVCQTAQSIQITSNVLIHSLITADRTGICHHLANEDRLNWIEDE